MEVKRTRLGLGIAEVAGADLIGIGKACVGESIGGKLGSVIGDKHAQTSSWDWLAIGLGVTEVNGLSAGDSDGDAAARVALLLADNGVVLVDKLEEDLLFVGGLVDGEDVGPDLLLDLTGHNRDLVEEGILLEAARSVLDGDGVGVRHFEGGLKRSLETLNVRMGSLEVGKLL